MAKRTFTTIVILGLFCVSLGFTDIREEDNETFMLATNMLNSLSLSPEKATETEAELGISGYISVFQGFSLSDDKDLPLNVSGLAGGRAAEFATVESSPGTSFGLKGLFGEKSSFDLTGKYLHPDDQFYFASLDLARIVRTETQVNRFLHRLDHDPLTNVDPDEEAQHEFPFVDSNPDDVYSLTRTEIVNKTDLVIPSIPNLKIKSQVRYVHKNGMQQARTMDMCSVCHIEAKTQGIDQKTMDFIVGAEYKAKNLTVSYSHLGRQFENNANPVTHVYTDPYGGRFAFSGEQEYAVIPDSEKRADTFKAKIDAVKNASLFGSYTLAKVKNKNNQGEADIKNFLSRFRALLGKGFNVTLKYAMNKYDNDMDPNYSFDSSTLVANNMSRDRITVGIDASYRIPKQRINLRLGYDYSKMDREFKWADEVEEEERDVVDKFLKEMRTKTFRAGLTFYPSAKIRGFLRYRRKDVENPLGVPLLPENNPVDPTTERFMTNLYTDMDYVSTGLSFTPANRLSLSANYFYNSSKNEDINSSQKRHNLVFSLWYALTNKVSVTASYSYLDDEIINSLVYGTQYELAGVPLAREDPDIPYNKKANVFLIALDFRPSDVFSVFGDFSVVQGESTWKSTAVVKGVSTEGLSDFSDQDLTHYRVSAGANYSFMKNMYLFGKWKYEEFKDRAFVIHGEGGYADSGKYHILYVGFGARF